MRLDMKMDIRLNKLFMFLLSNFIVLFNYLVIILVTYTFLKSPILNERTFGMAPEHAQLEFKVMNETEECFITYSEMFYKKSI